MQSNGNHQPTRHKGQNEKCATLIRDRLDEFVNPFSFLPSFK